MLASRRIHQVTPCCDAMYGRKKLACGRVATMSVRGDSLLVSLSLTRPDPQDIVSPQHAQQSSADESENDCEGHHQQ